MKSTLRPLTIMPLLLLLVWQGPLSDESSWHRIRKETAQGASGYCGRGWLVQVLGLGRMGSLSSGSSGRLRGGAVDEEKGLLFPLMPIFHFTLYIYSYIL